MLRPGPNASATHGRRAPVSIKRFSTKSTVGEDMLPCSASTSRATAPAEASRPSDFSADETIRTPPG